MPASAFAPNPPSLAVSSATNDVLAEAGTTIALGSATLTVNGTLDVPTVTAGSGKLVLAGTNQTAVGVLPAVEVTGSYALAGSASSSGVLTLTGTLKVNGRALVVDSLAVTTNGRLLMQHALDSVVVSRGAWFYGGSTNDTALTAGVLRIRGPVYVQYGSNFNAAGTHRTVLDGAAAQTVYMSTPGAGVSNGHFKHLEVANPAGVSFPSSNGYVRGNVVLRSGAGAVTGVGRTVTVEGDLFDTTGGRWQVGTTVFEGSRSRVLPAVLPMNVEFAGSDTLRADLSVAGWLLVTGTLKVNGRALVVDSLALTTNGRLLMQHALDSVVVSRGAWFYGGATNDTALTAGVLRIRGPVYVQYGSNFNAAGTHRTVLDGTAAQTVYMSTPGAGVSNGHFKHLEVANPAGVSFPSSNGYARGNVVLRTGAGAVTGVGRTVTVEGDLFDTTGGRWQVGTTVFEGSRLRVLPAVLGGNVEFAGSDTLRADLSVAGALSVTGTLKVNGRALVVDSLALTTNGRLLMQHALDSVVVSRGAWFYGGSTNDTALTAGVLRIRGPVYVQYGSNFNAAGTHRTVLDGTAAQTVQMSSPGAGVSNGHFMHLEIQNTSAAVALSSDVQVNGQLKVGMTAAGISGDGRSLTVQDTVQLLASLGTVTLDRLRVGKYLSYAGGTYAVDTTEFFRLDSVQTITPTVPYKSVLVSGKAALYGATTLTGDLLISGSNARLAVNGQSLRLTGGSLYVSSSGKLVMTNASDSVDVWGMAQFGGAPTGDSLLTAGVLRVKNGDFYVNVNSAFTPTGTHRVTLSPTAGGVRRIYFPTSGAGFGNSEAHFNRLHLERQVSDSIEMRADVYVKDSLDIRGLAVLSSYLNQGMFLPSTGVVRLHTGGRIEARRVEMGELTLDSSGAGPARFFADTAAFVGTSPIPTGAALSYQSIRVSDVTIQVMASALSLARDLVLGGSGRAGTLWATSSGSLTVGGNLRTEGSGSLRMDVGSAVTVQGNATFAGGVDTLLTGGTLQIAGNFVQSGSSTTFRASSSHTTEFNASGAQSISFAAPGSFASGAHFGSLKITNTTAGGVTLASNVYADGQFQSNLNSGTRETVFGSGHTLQVRGLYADSVVFDNVPLVFHTGSTVSGFSNVTFQNYADAATIFTIKRNAMEYLNFNNLVFPTPPPTVGYYLDVRQMTSGGNLNVTLSGTTPTAANNNNRTIITLGPYGPVVLSWLP